MNTTEATAAPVFKCAMSEKALASWLGVDRGVVSVIAGGLGHDRRFKKGSSRWLTAEGCGEVALAVMGPLPGAVADVTPEVVPSGVELGVGEGGCEDGLLEFVVVKAGLPNWRVVDAESPAVGRVSVRLSAQTPESASKLLAGMKVRARWSGLQRCWQMEGRMPRWRGRW